MDNIEVAGQTPHGTKRVSRQLVEIHPPCSSGCQLAMNDGVNRAAAKNGEGMSSATGGVSEADDPILEGAKLARRELKHQGDPHP
jgi:hypothetical protein